MLVEKCLIGISAPHIVHILVVKFEEEKTAMILLSLLRRAANRCSGSARCSRPPRPQTRRSPSLSPRWTRTRLLNCWDTLNTFEVLKLNTSLDKTEHNLMRPGYEGVETSSRRVPRRGRHLRIHCHKVTLSHLLSVRYHSTIYHRASQIKTHSSSVVLK